MLITVGVSPRQCGTTLIELMVTVAIVAILLGVAVPQMSDWIKRNSISSVADSAQNGLRLAQAEAIRRNAPVEFLLTDTEPSAAVVSTMVASNTGKHWAVRALDTTYAILANGYIGGQNLSEISSSVSSTRTALPVGSTSILFNGIGRVLDNTGTAVTATQVFRFSRIGADKAYCVFVSPGGAIKMCDPSLASGSPRACQPVLSLADCPPA